MPKVSIITTTYRHEKFIAHTIESVLAQSFSDWELLIGDDSPDDITWNIIEPYIQKYPDKIRAWHHATNKGIIENMDFLIAQSRGEILSFLEGDDMYTSDNLERKIEIFEQCDDTGVVYSDYVFVNVSNIRTGGGYRGALPVGNYISYRDRSKQFQVPFSWSTSACKKNIYTAWRETRFFPENDQRYSVSDYDFYFQTLTEGVLYYGIDSILVEYRWHSGNLSLISGKIPNDLALLYGFYHEQGYITHSEYIDFCISNLCSRASTLLLQGHKTQSLLILFHERELLRFFLYKYYIRILMMFFIPSRLLRYLYLRKISL